MKVKLHCYGQPWSNWYKQGLESEIACSDYLYSFFNAKFLFQKVNRFLKEERVFLSTLYCFLGDQKPLKKQAFGLKSIKNAYYFKSRKSYHKLRLALI